MKANFFAELKRRNVYKAAVAYAVVAWLIVQVATQVFPFFDVPNWAVRLVVITLVLGFPAAMIFSWAFEITPEGIKRESEIEANESIAPRTGRKLVAITAVLAVVATGLFMFQRLRHTARTVEGGAPATPAENSLTGAPARNAAQNVAGGRPSIPDKSIAVLPFENLSRDPDNAFFADGVQDEILTRLAKIADLKVISRTSTEKYRTRPDNLREIAQQLGVANILEGSVQKAGEQVRITVQLINALSDSHLWADTYDRKLLDTFAVESDVAQKIAGSLEAKLSGSEKRAIASRPTENSEAYQLFLKGRFFWNKRTGADLHTAADYFEKAITADANFAGAYAGLADAELLIPVFGAGAPSEFFPKATAAARHAIELDDTSAEGHTALALLVLFDFKFAESEREFRRAIELNPNYATAHHWFGNSLFVTLGRFDEAVAEGKRAVELDPLSLIINADLGSTLMIARRYDEAIAQLQRTLQLDSNFAYAHWNLGEAFYLKGNFSEAVAELEKANSLDDDPEITALLGAAYAKAGQRDKALAALAKLQEIHKQRYVRNYLFTIVYGALGDNTSALDYLEKAADGGETPDTTWIKVDPLFDPLRGEPRFQKLVAKYFPKSI